MSQFPGIQVSAEVIRAAAGGSAAAHEAIYRACGRPVYTLIRRLIPQAATADDLLQEVFVEILRSIGSFHGGGSFAGWVRSIAVSKCLMYLRAPWHRSLLWLDAQDEESSCVVLIDLSSHPDVRAIAQADLERALAALPALTRSVIWLHDVEGYTHHEIAQLLGRTASFSKSQLARAHVRLRELLDPPIADLPDPECLPCTPASTNC
jgi:RNA polymerase sigma-70 factor (ECF subfamily)